MTVAPLPRHDAVDGFQHELGGIRTRLWLERVLVLVVRCLALGFVATTVGAAVAWMVGVRLPVLYLVAPLALALGAAALVAVFRYPSAMQAALITDSRLQLDEQLATATEVVQEGIDGPVARAQVGAATESAAWAQENWRGGPRIGRDLLVAAALGFLTAGVLLLTWPEGRLLVGPRPELPIDSPRPETPPTPPPNPVAQKPQASKPEPKPSAQNQQGATAGVQRALDDIRRGRESGALGQNEAARRLGQAENQLSRQTGQSQSDRNSLDRLGQALDQVAAGRPAAEAIQRGDYEQAAREIAQLGSESDQLSQQAKQELSQALRQAAQDTQQSAPELSQRERRAADALAGRDYEAARQAMGELADQVATRGRNVIPQQELARAWDQVNQERRAQGQEPRQAAQPQQQGGQQGQQGGQQGQQGGTAPQPDANGNGPGQGEQGAAGQGGARGEGGD
ncbi:MAG: hypothetical protein M3O34_14095, partial [Chloroflexota bacterium]|nr:hypothetical protein [Chloroflexota bacterium]